MVIQEVVDHSVPLARLSLERDRSDRIARECDSCQPTFLQIHVSSVTLEIRVDHGYVTKSSRSRMDGPVAIRNLFGDCNLRPVAGFGETMILQIDLFGDLSTPSATVFGLDVAEHPRLRIGGCIVAGDELAETVGAEVVGDSGCFV